MYSIRNGERNTWPQRAMWLPTVQHLLSVWISLCERVTFRSVVLQLYACWRVRYSLSIMYCCQYICRRFLFRISVHLTRVTCFIWMRFYRKAHWIVKGSDSEALIPTRVVKVLIESIASGFISKTGKCLYTKIYCNMICWFSNKGNHCTRVIPWLKPPLCLV